MKKIFTVTLLCIAISLQFTGCIRSRIQTQDGYTSSGQGLYSGVEKITPNVKAANVNEIWKSVRKKLWPISKNEPKFTDINTTQLQELYGLDKDNFVKFVAKKSNDNDLMEILIVQVEDGKQNAVQNGINKRISDLEKALENTKPEQYTLVKNSVMVNNNKYILFIIGNKSPEIKSIFNDMTIDNK